MCARCVQDVFNLLPNLGVEELSRGFAVQSNDMMLAIYLASLTRSVLALHNLIGNKARAAPTDTDTNGQLKRVTLPLIQKM